MCRTEEIEAEAAHRAIVLANQARCPVSIIPVTSKSAAKAISEAKRKGSHSILIGECKICYVSLI